MLTKNMFLPNYSIGDEAYKEILNICPKYGKKVVFIGGQKTALSQAENKIKEYLKNSKIQILGTLNFFK